MTQAVYYSSAQRTAVKRSEDTDMNSLTSNLNNSFYFYFGSFSGLFRYFTGYFGVLKKKI